VRTTLKGRTTKICGSGTLGMPEFEREIKTKEPYMNKEGVPFGTPFISSLWRLLTTTTADKTSAMSFFRGFGPV
jgi:hypothetical protein